MYTALAEIILAHIFTVHEGEGKSVKHNPEDFLTLSGHKSGQK
jgi:hypothetical protein